jgi:hypothetical protein
MAFMGSKLLQSKFALSAQAMSNPNSGQKSTMQTSYAHGYVISRRERSKTMPAVAFRDSAEARGSRRNRNIN